MVGASFQVPEKAALCSIPGCRVVMLFLSLQEAPWDPLLETVQHRKLKILLQPFLGHGCFSDVITGERPFL